MSEDIDQRPEEAAAAAQAPQGASAQGEAAQAQPQAGQVAVDGVQDAEEGATPGGEPAADREAHDQHQRELTDDDKNAACMDAVNMIVSQRQTYYKLLKLVSTVNEDEALRQAVGEFPEMKTSIKTPRFFVKQMVDNYALEATPVYAPGEGPDGSAPDAPVAPDASAASEVAGVPEAPDAPEATGRAESAAAPEASGQAASPEAPAPVDAAAPQGEAQDAPTATDGTQGQSDAPAPADGAQGQADAPEPVTYTYELTKVGKRVMLTLSPNRRLETLYAQNPNRVPAFDFVLEYCTTPRKRDEIEGELKARGFVTDKRMGASYFCDRLERVGGLVWEGAWSTTQEGREFLDQAV